MALSSGMEIKKQTAVFHSCFPCHLLKINIWKSRKHTIPICCQFGPNISVSDVAGKTRLCSKIIKYIMNHPFSVLHSNNMTFPKELQFKAPTKNYYKKIINSLAAILTLQWQHNQVKQADENISSPCISALIPDHYGTLCFTRPSGFACRLHNHPAVSYIWEHLICRLFYFWPNVLEWGVYIQKHLAILKFWGL